MLSKRKYAAYLAAYGALALATCALAPFFGSEPLDPARVSDALFRCIGSMDGDIFLLHRLPRVLLAMLVGGSLAACGAALQVVLKNPLAEPFILGVAGGGAVGASVAISVPGLLISAGPFSSVQAFSLAGCLAVLAGIYRLASGPERISMNTILLAGVTFNILCGAAILLVRYLVSPNILMAMDRWMMGGLDVVGFGHFSTFFPLLVPGLALLFAHAGALNHLAFGEEMAQAHGVNVLKVQKHVFIGTGLATAAAVSVAGPIGFVGLIIPHAVRGATGTDHRLVLPASFLLGGAFLAACDTVARTVLAPTEMPVGIITAMIGGPVFLYILFKKAS